MHLLTYMQAIGQIYFEPVPQGTSDTMGPQLEKQFRMGNSVEFFPEVNKHGVAWFLKFNKLYNE